MRLTIAFKDLLDPSITPQILLPWKNVMVMIIKGLLPMAVIVLTFDDNIVFQNFKRKSQ